MTMSSVKPLKLILDIRLANLPAAEPSKHRPLDEPERDHEDMKTIMPSRSPSLRGVPFTGSGGSSSASKSPRSIEDWSDMAPDADDLGLGEKVAQVSGISSLGQVLNCVLLD